MLNIYDEFDHSNKVFLEQLKKRDPLFHDSLVDLLYYFAFSFLSFSVMIYMLVSLALFTLLSFPFELKHD